MNDVAKLQIEVDSKQIKAAIGVLESLEQQGSKTQNRFKSFGQTAQRIGRQLTTWLTLPILGAGAMAIKTAADYETLRTQLEVLTGSAEVAREVFGDLTEFAATTPFEIDGIVRANNLLLGFGVSINQTQDLLRTLGDVAAVSGGDLFSMARVFGEARAEGKLLTRDLRQLIAQGVPAVQLLAESMGVAEGQIFELATAGEITFERLVASFEMATAEGGLFFEGMEKRSATLAGIFSNFADSVNISLASVGDTLIETLDIKDTMRALVEDIENATQWFNELDGSAQGLIITFGLILAAAGPVIGVLGTMSILIGAITAPYAIGAGIVVALTAIGSAAYLSSSRVKGLNEEIDAILDGEARSVNEISQTIADIQDEIDSRMRKAGVGVSYAGMGVQDNALEATRELREELAEMIRLRDEQAAQDILGSIINPDASDDVDEATGSVERLIGSIEGIRSAVEKPVNKIIDPTEIVNARLLRDEYLELEQAMINMANHEPPKFGNFLPEPGSIAFIEDAIRNLENQIRLTSDASERLFLQEKVRSYRSELEFLNGDLEATNSTANDLAFTFSSAFEDAIVGGNSFRDVLDGILQDLTRIATQTLISKPLGNAFAGFLTGSDMSVTPTNDLIITDNGQVFQPHEDDTILAIKNMSGFSGGETAAPAQSGPVNVIVNNHSGANVEVKETQTPGGGREIELLIGNTVKNAINSGSFDRTMSTNYGIKRNPVSRG